MKVKREEESCDSLTLLLIAKAYLNGFDNF